MNMGALAADEVMISTQPRNFPGRNGSPKSRIYLASAATVASSALAGKISRPQGCMAPSSLPRFGGFAPWSISARRVSVYSG